MELLLKLYRGGYMSAEGVSESKMILEKGIVLPWCGEDEKKCKNIKKNGGLYTQCERERDVENVEYCKACEKSISKNGGVCEYGNVSERLSCGIMEYVDRKGGKVKSYSEYMKKNKLERSDVEKYGQMCGVVIPACHFENAVSEKKKRGRPKSEQEMTTLGRVDVEKKKRGRPKKEKQVVANGAGEELIASLCLPGLPTACLPTAGERCLSAVSADGWGALLYLLLRRVVLLLRRFGDEDMRLFLVFFLFLPLLYPPICACSSSSSSKPNFLFRSGLKSSIKSVCLFIS